MPRTLPMLALLLLTGCGHWHAAPWVPVSGVVESLPNPLPVPWVAREVVMDEVSDEVDNYFRILREQRVRLTDNVLTEGWIETEPRIGATLLEPWRRDSTRGFERVHASLQTVRRWAKVRVIPMGDRYLIDAKVYKELEDLRQPLKATVSGLNVRLDNALDADDTSSFDGPVNRGWIPLGRDFSLEQQLLANIQARISQSMQPPPPRRRHHR